jgi:hypothetical protein
MVWNEKPIRPVRAPQLRFELERQIGFFYGIILEKISLACPRLWQGRYDRAILF